MLVCVGLLVSWDLFTLKATKLLSHPGLNFIGWQVEIPKHQQLYDLPCNPARILASSAVMLSGT